jgi:hypothetical protein
MSPLPVSVTATMPPPERPSIMVRSISACISAMRPWSSCACFIICPKFFI